MYQNRSIYLTSYPKGLPTESNFKTVESTVREIQDGEVLVQTLYLSVDPYMRGRMSGRRTYIDPFPLGQVVTGGVVGRVVESKHPKFQVGDHILGNSLGWQDYSIAKGEWLNHLPAGIPLSKALGVIGMTGLTAYFGLLEIGQSKEGETVVVSGAAGAVGMTVGQIAKLKGCRVVGIAGSDEKVRFLKEELGFDEVINYKTTSNIYTDLKQACPDGVDIYFDNVGGEISDAVYRLLNRYARVPLCGQISGYNLETPDIGPRITPLILIKSALVKGFIVSDYQDQFPEAIRTLAKWYMTGQLKDQESIVEGLENTVSAFLGLFEGKNIGKQIVKVAE